MSDKDSKQRDLDKAIEEAKNLKVKSCNDTFIIDPAERKRMIKNAIQRGGIEEWEWQMLEDAKEVTVLYEPCELEVSVASQSVGNPKKEKGQSSSGVA